MQLSHALLLAGVLLPGAQGAGGAPLTNQARPSSSLAADPEAIREMGPLARHPTGTSPAPRFEPATDGGFRFDTGVLRGRLRAGGKSLGLTQVEHVPTGARLDRSNGLLSHYRVFTRGIRHGGGAWDWAGPAELRQDGSVAVRWPADGERAFELRGVYRWLAADRIELVTTVEAHARLAGFESFLACYFDPAFDQAVVRVKADGDEGAAVFQSATRDLGDWQMYARDEAAKTLIKDGRWTLEPNPVAWTFPALFAGSTATVVRRAATTGLTATLRADAAGCFALATPYATETHFSTYVSMFGLDLKPGETAHARVVLRFDASTKETPPAP